jgi:cysteine desulfurase family protein
MSRNSEKGQPLIYLDCAATGALKPPSVKEAVANFLENVGASPGRSAHRLAVESGRIVFDCREAVAQLLGAPDSSSVVFTLNATHALNLAFLGLLREGDRVVTTSMEHNSVMRPLKYLQAQGTIQLDVVECAPDGRIDPARLKASVTPGTRMVAVIHASNVLGTLLPVPEISQIAHEAGAVLLLDAAQTAGVYPVNVEKLGVDILACAGHKGLLGPHGTGILYVREGLEIEAVLRGGTGSESGLTEQPDFMPDKLECGTHNAAGIAGLKAGVEFILAETVEKIREHEINLAGKMLEGLAEIDAVAIYGTRDPQKQTATVSFNIKGMEPSDIGHKLDREYDIAVRVGLHCAPIAHQTMGTYPRGAVRASAGYLNKEEDIDALIAAVKEIASGKK